MRDFRRSKAGVGAEQCDFDLMMEARRAANRAMRNRRKSRYVRGIGKKGSPKRWSLGCENAINTNKIHLGTAL